MKNFILPHFDDNQPLNTHPMAEWLKDNVSYNDRQNTIDLQCSYLDSLGFITGEHTVPEVWFKTTRYVIEAHTRALCPGGNKVYKFSDLFLTEPNSLDHKFSVGGDGVYYLSDTLVSLIVQTSAIYELEPKHYYFQLIDNRLYMKYQQIIGQRKICLIEIEKV